MHQKIPRELIDVREAERITGLERSTLYRLARVGRLRSFKVLGRSLRFERSDLDALTSERKIGSATPQVLCGGNAAGEILK